MMEKTWIGNRFIREIKKRWFVFIPLCFMVFNFVMSTYLIHQKGASAWIGGSFSMYSSLSSLGNRKLVITYVDRFKKLKSQQTQNDGSAKTDASKNDTGFLVRNRPIHREELTREGNIFYARLMAYPELFEWSEVISLFRHNERFQFFDIQRIDIYQVRFDPQYLATTWEHLKSYQEKPF
jgi:hypothetical protein